MQRENGSKMTFLIPQSVVIFGNYGSYVFASKCKSDKLKLD